MTAPPPYRDSLRIPNASQTVGLISFRIFRKENFGRSKLRTAPLLPPVPAVFRSEKHRCSLRPSVSQFAPEELLFESQRKPNCGLALLPKFFGRRKFSEGVGFEPTDPLQASCFQDRCNRPLCHPSKVKYSTSTVLCVQ
jgi:hypothetical protein